MAAHLHVYPVLAGGALVAEGAGADHLGVAVDGDVAGRLVLAGVVLAQGVHLGEQRAQIRIIRFSININLLTLEIRLDKICIN